MILFIPSCCSDVTASFSITVSSSNITDFSGFDKVAVSGVITPNTAIVSFPKLNNKRSLIKFSNSVPSAMMLVDTTGKVRFLIKGTNPFKRHGIITQIIHDLGNWSIPQDCIPKCTLKLVTCIKEQYIFVVGFDMINNGFYLCCTTPACILNKKRNPKAILRKAKEMALNCILPIISGVDVICVQNCKPVLQTDVYDISLKVTHLKNFTSIGNCSMCCFEDTIGTFMRQSAEHCFYMLKKLNYNCKTSLCYSYSSFKAITNHIWSMHQCFIV
ncbi:hypothetical protein T02_15070 [Trichinella nativa]|uniref:Uncharacterized protein n=1 Tax=Trichinella nativa TaxID=6335 RepID=A0A0V1L164_9BILA|nr:hypothetical protein T02_15070 [Trichinella nativa]